MTRLQQFQTIDVKSADVSRMARLPAAYSQAEKREYAQPDSDLLRTNSQERKPAGRGPCARAPFVLHTAAVRFCSTTTNEAQTDRA